MNSSQASQGTLSRSSSQQLQNRQVRTPEDELISRINHYRTRVSALGQKLKNILSERANNKDTVVEFKDLGISIDYGSNENIEKLFGYINSLAEVKMTISEFQYSSYLNNIFTKNFGPYIEFHQGLIRKDQELDERLMKTIPSHGYQGVYLRGIDLAHLDSVICYLALKEFLLLSHGVMYDDFVGIETVDNENPQQISFFNPNYNTIVTYVSEKKDSVYLLYATDTLELINPNGDNLLSKTGMEFRKKTANTNGEMRKTAPAKYDSIRALKPDVTIDIVRRFVKIMDADEDGKVSKEDIMRLIEKKSMVFSEETIDEMFQDIFQRRCVKTENQRTLPVDDNEIFHSIRYKMRKSTDGKATVQVPPENRDNWLIFFNIVGLTLPKYGVPALKPKPILANSETSNNTFHPKINKMHESGIRILEPHEPISLNNFQPEAGILIQNTMNVQEMYIEDIKTKKPEQKADAFHKTINGKFGDLGKHSEFKTVEFTTKSYFQEALRLSENPQEYVHEKINPINKFLPVNYNTIYSKAMNSQTQKLAEKTKRDQNSSDLDEESMHPNVDPSKKITLEDDLKNLPTLRFKPNLISPIRGTRVNTPQGPNPIYGSTRLLQLSNSQKESKEVPKLDTGKEIFKATFKIPDHNTLKAELAKKDPITDPYSNPTPNNFRGVSQQNDRKEPFLLSWKQQIPGDLTENKEWDYRPREALLAEVEKKREEQLKHLGITKNSKAWTSYYKLAPRERGFVDHRLPSFIEKGNYVDGVFRDIGFVRGEAEFDEPFQLFHRSLRKTDKNLYLGQQLN